MGKFPLIILLFIFDFSLNSQSIRLEYGKLYSDEIKDNQIKYYHLPIQRDHESKIKGIKITSTLTKESNSKEKKVPIIIVSSQKLPNHNGFVVKLVIKNVKFQINFSKIQIIKM